MAYKTGLLAYKETDSSSNWLPASWRGVVPTGDDYILTDVNVYNRGNTTEEVDKAEIGIFEINAFALSAPHNVIPAQYFTQMFVTLRAIRNITEHSVSDWFSNNAMIFTFKPVLLKPMTFGQQNAHFALTTDGQIVCYVKDLECRIIRRIYDGIHTKDYHEVEKVDKRYDGVVNRGTLADQRYNFRGYTDHPNVEFSLSATGEKSLYNDIRVVLHDVVLVQRQDTFSSGNIASFEGYKLRDARGITVYQSSGVPGISDTILYSNKELKLSVPRDTLNANLDEYSALHSEVDRRIDYEWLMRQSGAASSMPTLFMSNVVSNMLSKVEFTDRVSDHGSMIYDATVNLKFANTETGELDNDHVTVTSSSNFTNVFDVSFTDGNKDETLVTARQATTQCVLDQCFLSSTLFGEAETDSVSTGSSSIKYFIDVIINDYYHTNGGSRTNSSANNRTAHSRHRIAGYVAAGVEITKGMLTNNVIPVTYDKLTVDKVIQYERFLLTPVDVANTFTSTSSNNTMYSRLNVKSKYIGDNVLTNIGSFTRDDIDVVIQMHDALANNKQNKDRYITPMEYYGSSSVESVELFEDDQLKTTAKNDEDAPTYFWVESLKNWCTFKTEVIDETSCTDAKLFVWNGVNGWYEFGSLLDFVNCYYVPKEKLKSLDPKDPADATVFANFMIYLNFMMSMYNFPLETLHAINIDRVYKPFEPHLEGKERSFLENVGHVVMTGVRAVGSGVKAIWDCANTVVNVITLDFDAAYDRWKDTWSDLWDMYTGIFTAVFIMPLEGVGKLIYDALKGSNANEEMYKVNFGKRLFARCFYVKLPYDSGYSSNDRTTYQTIRVKHRAEKAYGSIDGGVINRVSCAALNSIPTTIGSPFVTRSSTGELMIAYEMMYSGPIKEEADSHSDLLKYSGIAPIDVELSNQLLQTTLGSGEDKTIDDWLNVFGESDNYALSTREDVHTTNISTSVVEQHNIVSTTHGTLTVKSNRSKVSSDVETANINTVQKW